MKIFRDKVGSIQEDIRSSGSDGWLLIDFRRSNSLACSFLEIPEQLLLSRRWCYWIPSSGEPIKIVHRIESHVLDHLPGRPLLYSSWEELHKSLAEVLHEKRSVLMEYSPYNKIPTVSQVDGGTLELIRSFAVEVKSSADLLQKYTCVFSKEQLGYHLEAAAALQNGIEAAWKYIGESLRNAKAVSEYSTQQFLIEYLEGRGFCFEDPPICCVNAHTANPHYAPSLSCDTPIRKGDFILIDAWCKKRVSSAVYADITRVAVARDRPTLQEEKIFAVVKKARDAALELLQRRLFSRQPIQGFEVDIACRQVIIDEGFGPFFPHRTGHNIGKRDHGDGANIDSFETKEERFLLPGTCFSIEPGVYLPGEFGIRLEDDVYLTFDHTMLITKGMQTAIQTLG